MSRSRQYPIVARAIASFRGWSPAALVALMLTLVGCSPPHESGFGLLQSGMSETEVRELLGSPSVVVPAETGDDGAVIAGPRWQYGDTLSTMTTAATFPATVPDRVWVVWFDADGRVLTWRPPVDRGDEVDAAGESGRTPLFADPAPPRNR
jgi:hypothetical protein